MERMRIVTDNTKVNENLLNRVKELEEENKKLKKELSKYKHYYDRDKEELMESCYSLAKENDELKKELEKLKSTYVYDAKQVRDIC